MKITFIEPPYVFKPDPVNKVLVNIPGMAYVAAVLKSQGHDTRITDFKNDPKASLDDALDSDVVGIASYINGYEFLHNTLPLLKEEGKTIISGGPFISSYGNNPDNLLMRILPQIDYAVIGEGEITTQKLIEALEDKSKPIPKGVLFHDRGRITSTGIGEMVCDLDQIPEIDYSDWQGLVNRVKDNNNDINAGFSRGCYNRCSFCYQMFNGVRSFSLPRIDSMLEKIASFSPRQMMITDTTFTYDRDRAIGIARLAHKHNIRFGINTRVSDIDYELMKILSDHGCYHVHLGIESFDENVLKKANKNINLSQIYQAIKDCQNAGLQTIGFFLIGLPGENKQSLQKTIKGVKETGILPEPRLLIPLPGTQIYREAVKRGLIDEIKLLKQFSEPDKIDTKEGNWLHLNMSDGLSDEELIEARDKLHKIREELEKGINNGKNN